MKAEYLMFAVLEHEYCSGYTDNFGKWNTGFYCPQTDSMTAVYCCETPTFKYCCTIRQGNDDDINESTSFFIRTPVMVGIITGVTLVLLFITVTSCFFCSCCFVYKKRRAHLTGGETFHHCRSRSDFQSTAAPPVLIFNFS
ncbi:unnamed protein product [Allacma fusca]|uniref:Shisa N-terminal domain-containing protein n=1 Tax=Allacma fusca TaxID=39272 RepID=A0A8J2KQW1_9HEXA|nr:unnamed protein product [Allacma fusca]